MTSSTSNERPQTSGPNNLVRTNLTSRSNVATPHRQLEGSQARHAAAVAVADGSSRHLRSHSTPLSSSQGEVQDASGAFTEPCNQEFTTAPNQDGVIDSRDAWAGEGSTQSELKDVRQEQYAFTNSNRVQQAKIAKLEEQVRQEQKQIVENEKKSSGMAAQLYHRIKKRDTDIRALNDELRQSKHNALVIDNQHNNTIAALQQDVAHRDEQLTMAAAEIQSLQMSLEDCKERIFRMLPTQPVTDAQIATAYQGLCDSIETWMVDDFGDFDNALHTVITAMVSKNPGYEMANYINMSDLQMAKDYPKVDVLLLAALILRQLYNQLLDPTRIFPGLTHREDHLLAAIIQDDESIQGWRIDLQRSLGTVKTAQEKRSEVCSNIMHVIAIHLEPILPPNFNGSYKSEQLYEIITAASALTNNIRLSMARYFFQFVSTNTDKSRVLLNSELNSFDIVNVQTGTRLRPGSIIKEGEGGRCGKKLRTIRPGLVRQGTNGSKDLVLVKPSVLVEFDYEIQRDSKKKRAVQELNLMDQIEVSGGAKGFVSVEEHGPGREETVYECTD